MKKLVLASLAAVSLSTVANAAEPAFRISHGGLRYQMHNTTTEPKGGTKAETKESRLQTMYGGMQLAAFHNDWSFYAEFSNGRVGLGKTISEGLEVGAFLGLAIDNESEAKNERSQYTVAPYIKHAMNMDDMLLESTLSLGYTTGSGKGTGAGIDGQSLIDVGVSVNPYWRIGKNFEVGAGVGFNYTTGDDAKDVEFNATTINIVLQQWRYNF